MHEMMGDPKVLINQEPLVCSSSVETHASSQLEEVLGIPHDHTFLDCEKNSECEYMTGTFSKSGAPEDDELAVQHENVQIPPQECATMIATISNSGSGSSCTMISEMENSQGLTETDYSKPS